MARQVLYTPGCSTSARTVSSPTLPEDLGFAGFRLHAPLNRPDYLDERGVSRGELFPRARPQSAVWYFVAGRGDRHRSAEAGGVSGVSPLLAGAPRSWRGQVAMHALLDGPSQAELSASRCGRAMPRSWTSRRRCTRARRSSCSALRRSPACFCSAERPAGRRRLPPAGARFRGAADLVGSGEWFWRPLVNPEQLRLSLFSDKDPKGFGLMQRTRAFEEYEDLEARFGLRPSLWVEPVEGWGQATCA